MSDPTPLTGGRPRVVIIGAGFGGLRAARALRDLPVEVMLVDRNNYHLFQPLLYQVATAGLSPADIAYPVRAVLHTQSNADFRLAELRSADLAGRRLTLSTGELTYDYLVLAFGGRNNFFGLESVAAHGIGLKSLADAITIRNHVLRMFELAAQEHDPAKCRALLTFVVVGGGPTGVEMAGALSELIRLVLRRDFSDRQLDVRQNTHLLLIESLDSLLPTFPPKLGEATLRTLRHKHVEVQLGAKVKAYDGEKVTFNSGAVLAARTLIWAAGVQAAGVAAQLGIAQARQGRVVVGPTLQVPDHPNVFAIGDAAYLEVDGQPLPMVAPVAIQQAEVAAENIARSLRDEAPAHFVYHDPGNLATIGRNSAVADVFGLHLQGFIAWVMWLVVHLIQLIGFRNRLVVLINWFWDYVFYDRAVRLISLE